MTDRKPSEVELVAERLRVLGYVVEKMRCAVPISGGGCEAIIGPFAAEHVPMVLAVLSAIATFVSPLVVSVEDHWSAPITNRVIRAQWQNPVGEGRG